MSKFDNLITQAYAEMPSKVLTEAEGDATVTGFLRGLTKTIAGAGALSTVNFDRKNYYVQVDRKNGLANLRRIMDIDNIEKKPDPTPTVSFDPTTIQPNDLIVAKAGGLYMVQGRKNVNMFNVQLFDPATNKIQAGSTPFLMVTTKMAGFYNPNATNPKDPKESLPTREKSKEEVKAFNNDGSASSVKALTIAIYNAFDKAQYKLKHTPPELPSFTIEELVQGEIDERDKKLRGFGLKTPAIDLSKAHATVMSFLHNNPELTKEINYMKPEQLQAASKETLGKRIAKGIDTGIPKAIKGLGQELTKDTGVWL